MAVVMGEAAKPVGVPQAYARDGMVYICISYLTYSAHSLLCTHTPVIHIHTVKRLRK